MKPPKVSFAIRPARYRGVNGWLVTLRGRGPGNRVFLRTRSGAEAYLGLWKADVEREAREGPHCCPTCRQPAPSQWVRAMRELLLSGA